MTIKFENVAMALQFDGSAKAFHQDVMCIGWSADAAEVLHAIAVSAGTTAKSKKGIEFVSLPFVTLYARLQLALPEWTSLSRDVGMARFVYDAKSLPFGYAKSSLVDQERLRDTLARWIDGPLTHFMQKFEASIIGIERMRSLNSARCALRFDLQKVKLFPWGGAPSSQPSPFAIAPGEIASILAGCEIFPGLGPLVRIIDGPDANSAELMTRPIVAQGGRFSLVCQFSLETIPGALQPMVVVGFTRRRWATSLKKGYKAMRVGGYVFAHNTHPRSAFRFDLIFDRNEGWKTSQAYDELELQLSLAPGYAHANVLQYPDLPDTQALVMLHHTASEASKSGLDAGVPVADQLAAFERIVEMLRPLGFIPFDSYEEVDRKEPSVPRISMIRAPMVISQLLGLWQSEEGGEIDTEVNGIGAQLVSADLVESQVLEMTRRSLSEWFGSKRPILDARYGNLAGLVSAAVRESGIGDDHERRTLYVLVQDRAEIPWIKTVIDMMLGDAVDHYVMELPAQTHGPTSMLPDPEASKASRAEARARSWVSFAESRNFGPRPMFLIQANNWYGAIGSGLPDDPVNKSTARRTLAKQLGATVQYLLPAKAGQLDKYLMRLQAAVLDLVYGHAGRLLGLQGAVERAFSGTARRPEQVVAFGSMSVDMGTRRGTVLASIRYDAGLALPSMRLAHMEKEPVFTPWMQFDQALCYLASRTRLEIPAKKVAPVFFQNFLALVLDEVAATAPNAVVLIDATRHKGLWRRLSDATAKYGPQSLDAEASPRQSWSGLRIIRVRTQSPTMVNIRHYEQLMESGAALRVATSVMRLFRVTGSSAPTYWSYGKPIGQYKRGASCYRPMPLPTRLRGVAEFPPDYGQHQTPRGTEFVVLQAQVDDDIDRIALLCEQLRLGVPQARGDIVVRVPSPLHAIEKLADYMGY